MSPQFWQWLATAAAMIQLVHADGPKYLNGSQLSDSSICDCFVINGTAPAYYTKHMFFDFRSLASYAGVPDVIDNPNDAANAPPSSDFFASSNWTDFWNIQTWDNSFGNRSLSNDASVLMVNSHSNVFIESNKDDDPVSETYLTLRTRRLRDFQTASEFQSMDGNFQFLSMRMLARTQGAAGAVTGMFTYRDPNGKLSDVQESDVEILTRGPKNKVQYTNQPSEKENGDPVPRATTNSTTPDWSNWVVHRLDWTPRDVTWYVNDVNVSTIGFQTPRQALDIHFSAWSDGGSWSGNMSVDNEATQHVQWIEVLYNTTDKDLVPPQRRAKMKRDEKKCKVVCSIDESTEVGKAAVVSNNSSISEGVILGISTRFFTLTLTVAMVLALFV